jgi:hypothetical protein
MLPSAAKPFTASTARSVLFRDASARCPAGRFFKGEMDGQPEHFGRIASLDVVTLALAGITSDDSKVCACNGEDCAAIFSIRVELPLLRVRDGGHVRHGEGKKVESRF